MRFSVLDFGNAPPLPSLGHEAVEAALLSRRSVRAFLPRPVPPDLLTRLLTLAARAHGLDTSIQASFIDFHPVIRRHLRMLDDYFTVCGVSLGYADRDHRLDTLRTEREPLAAFVTFHGDETIDPTQP